MERLKTVKLLIYNGLECKKGAKNAPFYLIWLRGQDLKVPVITGFVASLLKSYSQTYSQISFY
jgi:hypothetical protein